MAASHEYQFSSEARKVLEQLLLPIGIYQLVGNKVITLLVSDGMCAFHNTTRNDLVNGFNNDMFALVHPDDVEELAKLGLRYATKEGPYNIVYRAKLYGTDEYRYVHAISKFHGMEDGSRIAITFYTDLTESQDTINLLHKEFETPAMHFLDQNIGPMVVVTRNDHRLLYYNKAVVQMLKPTVNYDSGLTFNEYFYSNLSHGIDGLFDEVDGGMHTVLEPKTGRTIEVNVLSCLWENEPAYTVFFYEYTESSENNETELRHARNAFNSIIYSGNYNGLEYYEQGYRGMWLWNLSEDRLISESGHTSVVKNMGSDISFDHMIALLFEKLDQDSAPWTLNSFSREALINSYHDGTFPKETEYKINTDSGQVTLHADITMMESPMDGSIFLKLLEENVTDWLELNDMLRMIVDQQYDFVAHIDLLSDHCRIFDGETDNKLQKDMSVSFNEYAETLAYRIGVKYQGADDLAKHLQDSCRKYGSASLRYERPDGRIKNITIQELSKEHKQYFLGCVDVTELLNEEKIKEAELQKARMQADAANEAKSSFLSSMSHDLRTPLNSIIGYTSFALKESDPEKIKDYLTKVNASGKILLSLINDTLELSRIESGKITLEEEVTLPDQLISDVVTALHQTADEKEIQIKENYQGSQGKPYLCDSLKLQRIALNLISNSVKYSQNGAAVHVSTKIYSDDAGKSIYTLTVEDNGIGMSEEFQARMFEPFSQEKRSEVVKVPGTGLGLSIVKKYVDLMKGTIVVESHMHQGTKFTVQIPMKVIDLQQSALSSTVSQKNNYQLLEGKHVLICEDNYLNLEIAETLLKDCKVLVDAAENGKIGTEKFAASAPGHYDVILMDIQMPVMGGYEATEKIRSMERPDAKTIPIIALSADAFDENIHEAKRRGMNGFITKPVSPQQMYEEILVCLPDAQRKE